MFRHINTDVDDKGYLIQLWLTTKTKCCIQNLFRDN